MSAVEQKVDCTVYDCPDGSKHLVFTIRDTQQCVGELRLSAADDRYLLAIAQLFSSCAAQRRGRLALPAAVRRAINGSHSH